MNGLHQYKLLAFVVAHKMRRQNSCLYKHEKSHTVAKELKMSPTTYRKYKELCLKRGYLEKTGEHFRFKKLSLVIYDLFGQDIKADWKHIRFFTGVAFKDKGYRAILDRIEFAVAECNFKRQEHRIRAVKSVINSLQNSYITHKEMSRAKRLARAKGCAISDLPSICKDNYIKTGKKHLSGLIGCSPTTATNRLKKWANSKIINKEVVKRIIKLPVGYATFDLLKSLGYRNFAPYGNGYIHTLGTKIVLL